MTAPPLIIRGAMSIGTLLVFITTLRYLCSSKCISILCYLIHHYISRGNILLFTPLRLKSDYTKSRSTPSPEASHLFFILEKDWEGRSTKHMHTYTHTLQCTDPLAVVVPVPEGPPLSSASSPWRCSFLALCFVPADSAQRPCPPRGPLSAPRGASYTPACNRAKHKDISVFVFFQVHG